MVKIKFIHRLIDRYNSDKHSELPRLLQEDIDAFLLKADIHKDNLISVKHQGSSNKFTSEASVLITYNEASDI